MSVNISAAEINKLRQQTGAGMMDCRKALVESEGDFEQAIDYLRKKGQKVAALRSDRETKEGVVISKTSADNKKGVIVCVSCETDFVAKNSDFVNFAQSIADIGLNSDADTAEAVLALPMDGATVADKINDQVARIGEKINLSRFNSLNSEYVVSYIHGNYRMGVLVAFNKAIDAEPAKDIAMQIAAMNPLAVDASAIPADVVEREKAIVMDLISADPKMAGKPQEMLTKIAEGKLNAFFKENTLLAQGFVKDSSKTVEEFFKGIDTEIKVESFKRVAIG